MNSIKALFRKFLGKRWQWYYLIAAVSLLIVCEFGNDKYTGDGADGAALGFAVFASVCIIMAEKLRPLAKYNNDEETT